MDSSKKLRLSPSLDISCGAFAGMTSRMIVAPLDVVKIRFQVQAETQGRYFYNSVPTALRTIARNEGISALWKGNGPALLMVTPYSALQLSCFYQLKQSHLITLADPYASLAIGAASAALATVFTYPLDLLRTRLAAQPEPKQYFSLPHAVSTIVRTDGVQGLYVGLRPTLVEIVPYMAIHFAFYEHLKARVQHRMNVHSLKPYQSMLVGATAGTISKLLTLPLDNAKKVMQVQSQFQKQHHHQQPYRGVFHVLHSLWKRHGTTSLFRGAIPSLLKAAPSSAVTFMVYESAKNYLLSA